ncbi:hypothetical protein JZ751_027608 [Albula glossodonta]|uniref:Integrin beta n=1 Tax=Albula glossodonta TaxID=121402 RepID=A0A8T2NDA4_9TELE|nr:hypothetical protein JZ751_027608 [Albula glossodonta]
MISSQQHPEEKPTAREESRKSPNKKSSLEELKTLIRQESADLSIILLARQFMLMVASPTMSSAGRIHPTMHDKDSLRPRVNGVWEMLCALQLAVIMGLMLGAQRPNAQECPSPMASTCEECISSSPHCAWCKDKEERTLRCDTREALRGKGCAEKHILDPESQHTSFDSPAKDAQRAARLSPQKLSLELRPGSFMAKDSLHRAAHLGTQVLSAVQEVVPESQSRDQQNPDSKSKVQPGISFSHSPSLSDDLGPFSEAPEHRAPKGGLLALMQAAVCGDVIGWSNDNARLLVYASDHEFYVGKGQTWNASSANGCLTENNIQVIFAVTEEVADKYKELSEALPKSTVAVLPSDLRDIKATITEAYNRLWSSWAVRHTHVPGMNISYSAECPEGERRSPHRGECSVSVNVTVSMETCLEPQSFHIQLMGSPAKLGVQLKSICTCECGDTPDPSFCSYSGKLSYGVTQDILGPTAAVHHTRATPPAGREKEVPCVQGGASASVGSAAVTSAISREGGSSDGIANAMTSAANTMREKSVEVQ